MASSRSSPPPGSSSISPIPICASSRSATSATTRPIARAISRARCGSTGRRRAGTRPIAISFTPAAMAKLFGSLGIGPQSTVVLYGDPVQFGSYAYLGLHHGRPREPEAARRRPAQMGDGEAAAVARRAAFSRRRLSAAVGPARRCGSAATMCARICASRNGCSSTCVRRRNIRASVSPTIPSPSITAPSAPGASPAPCISISRTC